MSGMMSLFSKSLTKSGWLKLLQLDFTSPKEQRNHQSTLSKSLRTGMLKM